jgi:hypothetical protein
MVLLSEIAVITSSRKLGALNVIGATAGISVKLIEELKLESFLRALCEG